MLLTFIDVFKFLRTRLWWWQVHHEKFFCTEYEKSKVNADKIALQAASEGIPIVPVYPGVIYGVGKFTAGNVVARMVMTAFSLINLCWMLVQVIEY